MSMIGVSLALRMTHACRSALAQNGADGVGDVACHDGVLTEHFGGVVACHGVDKRAEGAEPCEVAQSIGA